MRETVTRIRKMSEIKDDGGQAFPQPGVYDGGRNEINPVSVYYDAGGMSLRDYFASKAMQGFCAYNGSYGINNGPGEIVARAYEIADAMLEARKK
jgi:hypothetical protein